MAKRKRSVKSRKSKRVLKSNLRHRFVIFFFVLSLGCGFYYFYDSDLTDYRKKALESIPEGFPTFGIDVSHHQGEIDWEHLFVEQHFDTIIHFVYCKATEGTDHYDTQWEKNRKDLLKLNIPHGAYHFFNPNSDPELQADHFLKHWKKSDYDLPPVLDVETEGKNDRQLIEGMQIWLQRIEKKSGMRPVIYTSLNFFETKFMTVFKDYKFWIAAYSRRPQILEDSRIIHWQYSESGELPEIEENVDFNVSKIQYR